MNIRFAFLTLLIFLTTFLGGRAPVSAEPLRIVYTAISLMYGPLWVTQDAGLFKKHNLDVELLYLSGGTLSTAALISGDVQIAFTGAANVVAANLTGSDVVLLGATIDLLPFEVWSVPTIKEPSQIKGTKMGVTRIGSTTHFVARYVLKQFGWSRILTLLFFRPWTAGIVCGPQRRLGPIRYPQCGTLYCPGSERRLCAAGGCCRHGAAIRLRQRGRS